MSARKRVAIAAVAVVLAAALGGCSLAESDPAREDTSKDGPIAVLSPHGWSVESSVGDIIVDGLEVIHTDEGTATITGIDIEGDPRIEFVDAMVAGVPREIGAVQHPLDWPPTDPDLGTPREAIGAVVETVEAQPFSTELLIAMRITEPGQFLRTGVWVEYEADGKAYREFLPGELTICSPDHLGDDGTCPFLGGGAE